MYSEEILGLISIHLYRNVDASLNQNGLLTVTETILFTGTVQCKYESVKKQSFFKIVNYIRKLLIGENNIIHIGTLKFISDGCHYRSSEDVL